MNNKYLEIEDLSVKYGDFLALNQVSWSEYSSGIVGLIGNNGAGKTTLIKSILGLISSQSKKLFKGVAQAQISYCPDKPLFEPWLTPQEVLEQTIFLTYLQDSSVRRACLHSIADFLNEVDLFKHKDKKVGGFSRGMMQRLGIAVSLVTHPKMLFLDEPTSALDPLGIQEIESLIKEYSKNALIVYSTHNLDQLERISDKVFLLDKGKKLFYGDIEVFLAQHANQQTVTIKIFNNSNMISRLLKLKPLSSKETGIVTEFNFSRQYLPEILTVLASDSVNIAQIFLKNTNLMEAFIQANDENK